MAKKLLIVVVLVLLVSVVLYVAFPEVLKAGFKDSTTVIMKDCGHVPMMERPEETARHYTEFLAGR